MSNEELWTDYFSTLEGNKIYRCFFAGGNSWGYPTYKVPEQDSKSSVWIKDKFIHKTATDAVTAAIKTRESRIASLKKQIAKLEARTFHVVTGDPS